MTALWGVEVSCDIGDSVDFNFFKCAFISFSLFLEFSITLLNIVKSSRTKSSLGGLVCGGGSDGLGDHGASVNVSSQFVGAPVPGDPVAGEPVVAGESVSAGVVVVGTAVVGTSVPDAFRNASVGAPDIGSSDGGIEVGGSVSTVGSRVGESVSKYTGTCVSGSSDRLGASVLRWKYIGTGVV